MRGREGVVDIDVGERGHALGELEVVLFLAGWKRVFRARGSSLGALSMAFFRLLDVGPVGCR